MFHHIKKIEKFVTLGGRANARTEQFLRYTVTASSSFVLDLFLLWVFTEVFGIYYLLSVGLSFGIAISVNYVTSRAYAFQGSHRGQTEGYILFVSIALFGMAMVVLAMRTLVENFGIPYLLARLVLGGFVGMWNYSMNAFWNFKN